MHKATRKTYPTAIQNIELDKIEMAKNFRITLPTF
jgi:hypothetical protein